MSEGLTMDSRVGRGGKERGGGGKRRLRFSKRGGRNNGRDEMGTGRGWGYTMKRKLRCFRFRLMFRIGIRD